MKKTFLRPEVISNVLLVAVSLFAVMRLVPLDNWQSESNGISISVREVHAHRGKERTRITQWRLKRKRMLSTDRASGTLNKDTLEVRVINRFEFAGIRLEIGMFGLAPVFVVYIFES